MGTFTSLNLRWMGILSSLDLITIPFCDLTAYEEPPRIRARDVNFQAVLQRAHNLDIYS